MDPKIEAQSSTEKEKTVDTAWIFDVDGVLTHPERKRITEPELFDEIIKRLRKGEPTALVTGRSLSWLQDRVIGPLEQKVDDRSLLSNFFAVGEKGGSWFTFDNRGRGQQFIDGSISTPQFLQDEIRKIISEHFPDSMFYDETKQTMISTEMRDDIKVENYRKHQERLNELLETLLQRHNLTEQLKVDPTRIATDVESNQVGKALGARKVLGWLKEQGITPRQFITFGDSKSDVAMAQEIHSRGFPTTFVFVGEREQLKDQEFSFPTVYTQSHCEKGTLEYLQSSK